MLVEEPANHKFTLRYEQIDKNREKSEDDKTLFLRVSREIKTRFDCTKISGIFEVKNMNVQNLGETEKKTYNFIQNAGEVQTTNVPKQMWGAIPSLKNKGLIEIFKKYTSYFRSRKKKFVKVRE